METEDTAKKDRVLMYLYERVLAGAVSVYQADVPTSSVIFRFDVTEFERHPALPQIIQNVKIQIGEGRGPRPFLYPEGENLICSDDEIIVLAYKNLGIKTLPAFILGEAVGTPAVLTSKAATKEQARELILGS